MSALLCLLTLLRIRKVRCDLTRPACNRCNSAARQCEGFPIDLPRTSAQLPPLSSRAATTRPLALAPAPSSIPSISEHEQRYFSYFKHQTARQFGGYFEDELWSQLVLQLAMSEAVIFQVTVALGQLHEKFDNALDENLRAIPTESDLDLESFGQPYNKAIQHLQAHLNLEGWKKLEVTLIACILCVGFDWLRGDASAASIHLRSGLGVLQEWYNNGFSLPDCPDLTSPAGQLIQAKIVPFYRRLVVQTASLYDFSLRWTGLPTIVHAEIDHFSNLQEARDSLMDLIGQMHLVPETRALLKERSRESKQEHQRFEELLLQWKDRFDVLVQSGSSDSANERLDHGFHILKLLHLLCIVMLRNIYTDRVPDGKDTEAFQQALDIAEDLLHSSDLPRFTVDLGLVALIYYVAIHCSRPEIYQKALELLASRTLYEGYWNSMDAVRVAEKKIQRRAASGRTTLSTTMRQ
jgi:hypothetical protein